MAKPRPAKAKPSKISAGMTAAAAFACVARECLVHLRANEPAVTVLRHPEAVHQARVAIRKLRSALLLFRDILKQRPVKAVRRDLKELFQALGRCRDLDVFMAGPGEKRSGRGKLPKGFKAARAAAYDAAVAVLGSDASAALLADIEGAAGSGAWLKQGAAGVGKAGAPIRDFARDCLDGQWMAMIAGGEDLASLDPPALHRLRIRVKNLRYAAEFFAGLFDEKGRRRSRQAFMTSVRALQDQLGRFNDLAVARAMTDGATDAATERYAERCLAKAVAAHARLVAVGPFWSPPAGRGAGGRA